jgi:hypothetical protein
MALNTARDFTEQSTVTQQCIFCHLITRRTLTASSLGRSALYMHPFNHLWRIASSIVIR